MTNLVNRFTIRAVTVFTLGCIGVSKECRKMLTCNAAASTGIDYSGTYDEGGSCWTNESRATSCTDACRATNASLKETRADVAECQ